MYLLFEHDLRSENCYEDFVGVFGSFCAATSLRIVLSVDCAGFDLLRPMPQPAPRPTTKATMPMSIVAQRGVPLVLVVVVVAPVLFDVAGVAETTAGFTVKIKAP